MKALPTTNRPCKGRNLAWSRTIGETGITVRAFKRDSTGRTYMASHTLHVSALVSPRARSILAGVMLAMRAQARWAVDQIDFQLLGLQDTTPPPTTPWVGDQAPPYPAPAGYEWVVGSFGFNCSGQVRQDPPRLEPKPPYLWTLNPERNGSKVDPRWLYGDWGQG